MARLVLLRGHSLTDVPEISKEGLDISFDSPKPSCGPIGTVDSPRLRFSKNEFGKVSFVRLAGAPIVMLQDRKSEGAPLCSGDHLEVGDYTIYVWNPPQDDTSMSEADLRLLFSMTRDLSLVDFDGLMARMMDRLMDVFESERGFILLKNRKTGKLQQAIARKIPESEMGEAASRTVVKRVLKEQKTITLGDAGSELEGARSVRADKIRSVIAAPLMYGKEVFGVVYLDSQAMRKIYTPRELNLLDVFTTHVSEAIETALEKTELERDMKCLKALRQGEARQVHDERHIVGKSRAMTTILQHVQDVGKQEITCLILGESGTGKELVARAIHAASPRKDGPFVAVNCMALSREVTESELFGHEKGAFTGAEEQRIGRFELAAGGTIFLDEVGELDQDIQVKLLRVLEERQIERVGGNRPIDLDVRVVAATNRDMKEQIAAGHFREDLYYRLNVFSIDLPSLRERPEDVPEITHHFITLCNSRMGRNIKGCTKPAMEALCRYGWPGNVRELRNVIERAFILERNPKIELGSLPADIVGGSSGQQAGSANLHSFPPGTSLAEARETFELEFMQLVLKRCGGTVSKAAKELDIPRSTIYRKFTAAGIDPKDM